MLRRLAQIAGVGIVVAYAFPHAGEGIRTVALGAAVFGLVVVALGLALRPLLNGLRPQRRDEQRNWPFS